MLSREVKVHGGQFENIKNDISYHVLLYATKLMSGFMWTTQRERSSKVCSVLLNLRSSGICWLAKMTDERVSDSFLSWSLCHSGWLTLGHMFVVSPLSLSLHCLLTAWAELIIGLPPLPSIARITYHIFTSVFQWIYCTLVSDFIPLCIRCSIFFVLPWVWQWRGRSCSVLLWCVSDCIYSFCVWAEGELDGVSPW